MVIQLYVYIHTQLHVLYTCSVYLYIHIELYVYKHMSELLCCIPKTNITL